MVTASLVVLAYNQLQYTTLCMDSIYAYTKGIDFEVITVNNGSSDGTKEYFDSLPNKKKINYDTNVGIEKAINDALSISEGKYFVLINNDIVVTTNWLNNIITIMESDPKIGAVVPGCNASANDQIIKAEYYTISQLQEFAKDFNKSNPLKWEERLDLSMYLVTFRTEELKNMGALDEFYTPGGHDDDDLSFRFRRAGYKLIFTGDTYVHHYGSKTMQQHYSDKPHMKRNLDYFISKFGVDVFKVVLTTNYNLLDNMNYSKTGFIDFLTIGNTCGNTMLRAKGVLRSKGLIDGINLTYYTNEKLYLTDLNTFCNKVIYDSFENIDYNLQNKKFDYIYIDEPLECMSNVEELLLKLKNHLKDDGELMFLFSNITNTTKYPTDMGYSITTRLVINEKLEEVLKLYNYTIIKTANRFNSYFYIVKK